MTDVLRYWKGVGGYTYCVLWRGRWHYAGDGIAYSRAFHAHCERHGIRTYRVPGMPAPIAKHFRTLAQVVKELPHWNEVVVDKPSFKA